MPVLYHSFIEVIMWKSEPANDCVCIPAEEQMCATTSVSCFCFSGDTPHTMWPAHTTEHKHDLEMGRAF